VPVGVLGSLPTWLDLSFVRAATGVLAIVSIILAVIVFVSIRSIGTRLVVVAMLGAAVFGLMQYRQDLDHCDKRGCPCKFLGEDLKGGGCTPTR
jgi:hypothetical protein